MEKPTEETPEWRALQDTVIAAIEENQRAGKPGIEEIDEGGRVALVLHGEVILGGLGRRVQ